MNKNYYSEMDNENLFQFDEKDFDCNGFFEILEGIKKIGDRAFLIAKI